MRPVRRAFALPLLAAALLIGACDAGGPENRRILLDQLANREAFWAENGSSSYTIDMTRDCFCEDDANRWQVSLQIVDDEIVAGQHVFTQAELTTEELAQQYTVEDLFAVVRDALNRGVAGINISYDQDYGYVDQLYIDYNARTSDDDITIVVESFSPTASGS